jgi:hypothetical protein
MGSLSPAPTLLDDDDDSSPALTLLLDSDTNVEDVPLGQGSKRSLSPTTARSADTSSAELDPPIIPLMSNDEFDKLFPMRKLNDTSAPDDDDEVDREASTPPPTKKTWVRMDCAGPPFSAFKVVGRSSGFAERASLQLVGSRAFAAGAAFSQALMGNIHARMMSVDVTQNLPSYSQDSGKAILNRVATTPGIRIMTGAKPFEEANAVIAERSVACQFYAGITERPVERWQEHQGSAYRSMFLWTFPDSGASGSLEKAVIDRWMGHPNSMNIGAGGLRATAAQPHFFYVVVRPHGLTRR